MSRDTKGGGGEDVKGRDDAEETRQQRDLMCVCMCVCVCVCVGGGV